MVWAPCICSAQRLRGLAVGAPAGGGGAAPHGKHPSCTESWPTCAGSSPSLPAGRAPTKAQGQIGKTAQKKTNPAEQQGMVVLGTPLGSDAFVDTFLRQKIEAQASLFSNIPTVPDLQAAWLLLLMCAAPRCHRLLCALPPSSTAAFARSHDEAVLGCLRELLANDSPPVLDALATKKAQLPLHFGGLGLRSAETSRIAAHWASWADTLPTLRGRHPVVVEGLLSQAASQRRGEGGLLPCVAAALSSQFCLQRAGFDAPTWHQLIETFFFFFFLARLFPPASQSLVPSNYPLLQDPGGTAGTSAWSLTAGGYGELPAHVGKDLVQLRRIPSHIALAGKWEFEEGRGKCALRGNCEQPRPTRNPS